MYKIKALRKGKQFISPRSFRKKSTAQKIASRLNKESRYWKNKGITGYNFSKAKVVKMK